MGERFSALLVSGSLRAGSTNATVLATASEIAPSGVSAIVYAGMGSLPHFNPDDDQEGARPAPEVASLRAAVGFADGILICTPEYAGALPGALKNLLEWTVGDGGLYGKPVAWINISGPAAPTGGADAHDSLRKVLGYVGAQIVEDACVRVPVTRDAIGADRLIADRSIRAQIVRSLETLAASSRRG